MSKHSASLIGKIKTWKGIEQTNASRASDASSGTNLNVDSSSGNFVGSSPYKRQENTASQNTEALKKKKTGTNALSSKGLNIT